MAENEPPAPSGVGTGADAADAPRPIARRPHPVIKPSTESISLQPIGGGAAQPPGTPIGSAGPAPAAPPAPAPLTTPGAPPPNMPLSPPSLGGIGSQSAPPSPVAAAAPTGAAAPAAPKPGGLSAVGQAGGTSAPIDINAALNTHPDAANPYLSSGRPDIDRRPVSADSGDASGFDTQKAVKIGVGVIVAFLAFFIVRAAIPSNIPVPDKFTTYTSASSAFSLEAPEGWARKGMDIKREDSMTGQQYEADTDGVTITYGKGIIQVWTDTGGDVMQNQLLSGGGPNFGALLDDKHKQFMGVMKKRVGGFQEADSGSFSLAPFGAKVVEYTGTSGFLIFGTKVHGYAATVQGPKHFMQILLQCPENNWDDLKPVYERILKSAALDGVSAKTLQERLGGFGGAPAGGGSGGGGSIQIPGGGSVSMPRGVGGF